MSYFDFWARTLPYKACQTLLIDAYTLSTLATRERRLEGSRLFKRGMVNEMPFHLYSSRARRAMV